MLLVFAAFRKHVGVVLFAPRVGRLAIVVFLFIQGAATAAAQSGDQVGRDAGRPTLTDSTSCWVGAGSRYGVDPALLQAIAWKESRGWTNAIGPKLPDGNRALGLMQINSIHLPQLAHFGIRREDLFDACTSQTVAAWVLADCIAQVGATWRAVGCYYAGPASKNVRAQHDYVVDVQRFYAGYKKQPDQPLVATK